MPAETDARVVVAGAALAPVSRTPSPRDLVRFAHAANDYAPLHYDQDYARERGFSRVIVHGFLKATMMSRVVTEWFGETGWLAELRTEYRRPDLVGEELTAHGTIREANEHETTIDLWVESTSGERTATGFAVWRWNHTKGTQET